ncbi:MAG: tryptophan synthase subunit alpha [Gemmatimonadales bacterium]
MSTHPVRPGTAGRYEALFARLPAGEAAFIPFLTLGDPTPADSARLIDAVIRGGADALELGLPFSDPVADGPVIQAAAVRALGAGTTLADCWHLIAAVRARHPELPIGLLGYANLAFRQGLDGFYAAVARAGADSVLLADVPAAEAGPFQAAAEAAGVAQVLIAPPNADGGRLRRIAGQSRGYTYVTSRGGVTGDDGRTDPGLADRLAVLAAAGGAPAVLGFGISTPAHVRAAAAAGARGVIAGSALVRRVAEGVTDLAGTAAGLERAVRGFKDATA